MQFYQVRLDWLYSQKKSVLTLCWLIEVIFLLGFFYLLFIFVSYLGSMVHPCRHTQSSIKGIDIEGCKIPIGFESIIKRNNNKVVKQYRGPNIYLG